MKAVEMQIGMPYKAITQNTDGADIGEYMCFRGRGQLCLASNGGAALEESEWMCERTCDFEVEEAMDYYIDVYDGVECIRRRRI